MVVTSCKNKFIILDELKSLLSMRKYDIERLISLFSEYCLCDLNLDESQIEFLKKGNFYGSYSASAGIVRLNMKKNMSSLYELLNTIAHEHKHKKQDVNKEKRFKLPTKGLSSNFPLKNMNGLIYTLMLYDEEIDLSSLEFTSDSEKDAREYAIILIDKLINDLSFLEACDNNTNKYYPAFSSKSSLLLLIGIKYNSSINTHKVAAMAGASITPQTPRNSCATNSEKNTIKG